MIKFLTVGGINHDHIPNCGGINHDNIPNCGGINHDNIPNCGGINHDKYHNLGGVNHDIIRSGGSITSWPCGTGQPRGSTTTQSSSVSRAHRVNIYCTCKLIEIIKESDFDTKRRKNLYNSIFD